MDTEILKLLKIAKNDYKVYESILRGNVTIGQICLNTHIHRRNVYDCVNRLIARGLLSFFEENKMNYYTAEPPEKILKILKEEKENISRTEEKARNIIKNLKIIKADFKKLFNVRVFVGKEGLKNIYDDILKTGKDYVGFGPGRQLEKIMKYYLKNFIKNRVKNSIWTRQIYDEGSRGFKYTKNPLLDVRYLPDESCSHAALRIYGNKTVIMLLDTKEPLAILIENGQIANGYRKYFEVLWETAKP